MTISPEESGCVGDGVTDDTVGMQAALDAAMSTGATLVNRGGAIYVCGALTIGGGTTWNMGNSTIKAASSLDPAQPQLTNKITTGTVDYTYDDDIRILGGKFLCDLADRSEKYLSFVKCGNLLLEGTQVIGPRWIGIGLGGCKDARINGVTLTGTGKLAVTVEGGPAIWMGSIADGSTCDNTVIDSPYIHDTNWSAIYANGNGCRLIAPRIVNVRESAIFANAQSYGLQIIGGVIDGVRRKNISASGIELGGVYHRMGAGLLIRSVDNCAISLTDAQNIVVSSISTVNARRDATRYSSGSHIEVISHGTGGSTGASSSRDTVISGHMAFDGSLPSFAAVNVSGSGDGAPIIGLSIAANNYATTPFTHGSPLAINPTYWSALCSHSGNNGAND